MTEYAPDTKLARKMSEIQDEAAHRASSAISTPGEDAAEILDYLIRIEGHLAAIAEFLKAKA